MGDTAQDAKVFSSPGLPIQNPLGDNYYFRVTLLIVNILVLGRFRSVLTELFLGAVCALYTSETLPHRVTV